VIWGQINNIYNKSVQKTLRYYKKPKYQWLLDGTWNLIEERRITKLQILLSHNINQIYSNKNYRMIDRPVKKNMCEDKCHFYKAKATKPEQAAKNGNSR